ncbi:glutathione binding-like protein [Mariluticola halotolerans]|uniref:glutathione binding-like protein n=1 Tax=Mariluticola halotolerans TaxID=2909283 RepID=UPI0026E3DD59|nr:glutathione binding-like protein [Mariluticola halotolerans]UJQ95146.1 glutathione binding-like protein [Mariluticola halotolerans]
MTDQTQPIELHYWPTPNGFKISIMLEELGVPYTIKLVNIGAGDQFKPEFLKIAPNNRMPAIVDPEGPDGKPISVFESGAILKYLGQKFGQFYPADPRAQVKVDEWLFWQMGGFGPMLGQNHHFAIYAPEKIDYAIKRYRDESHRLYGVLNKQLAGQDYICGDYSIADMACIGWANGYERQGIDIAEFPDLKAWLDRMNARPAVARGLLVGKEEREKLNLATDKKAQSVLFNQR